MALTDKQEMFCREYLIDLNATQAALRVNQSKFGFFKVNRNSKKIHKDF